MDNTVRKIIEMRKSVVDMGLKLTEISLKLKEIDQSGEFNEMPQGYYEGLKSELNKAREALANFYSEI